jgi:heptaprenyl diphosphate synthase
MTALSKEELEQAVELTELPTALARPLAHLLGTTGKQLRSSILIACAQAGRRADDPEVRRAAIAIELFQLATLAHDDVVDDGKVRRGTETITTAYGNSAAGFVGGVLFSRALEMITACGAEPTERFASMASDVCRGQMKENEGLFDGTRSFDHYYSTITGKTASLFDLAAWLGAWLAGADETVTAAYAQFGRKFGVAFQIADDILDLVGSEAQTGKSPAKDLRQGIYNLPVLHAFTCDPDLRDALDRDGLDGEIDVLLARIRASGGIQRAVSDCRVRADGAVATLRDAVELRPACIESPIALLLRAVDPALSLELQADAA